MAHQFIEGFFSNNEPAWHGLGQVLPAGVWPGKEEAMRLAGLEYLQHHRKTRVAHSKLNRSMLSEDKAVTNLHKLVLEVVR